MTDKSGNGEVDSVVLEKELELLRRENELLKRENDLLIRERDFEAHSESGSTSARHNASSCLKMGISDIGGIVPEFFPGMRGCLTASEWISNIDGLKSVYEWDPRSTLFYATSRLKGAAKFWFNSRQAEITTWEVFKAELSASFPEAGDETDAHRQLMKRKRKSTECIEEYFYEVCAIAKRAKLSELATIKYIVSGLGDNNLINILTASECRTLPALLNKIKAVEEMDKQKKSRDEQNIQRLEHRQAPDSSFKFMSRYTRQPDRPIKVQQDRPRVCFKCRKPGHLAYQCGKFKGRREIATEPVVNCIKATNEFFKEIFIEGVPFTAFIDLGSDCSTIKVSEVKKNGWKIENCSLGLHGFAGGFCRTIGKIKKNVRVEQVIINTEIVVVADTAQEVAVIIGRDYIDQPNVKVIKEWGKLYIEWTNKDGIPENMQKVDASQDNIQRNVMAITKRDLTTDDFAFETTVPQEAIQKLLDLLQKYRNCVSLNMSELGKTDLIEMKIQTKTEEVVRYKPYRVPYGQKQQLDDIINELLENDIIEESTSEFASPVILVPKKNGALRMCVDYRKVNSITRRENFPTPNIEEQLNSLVNKKIFSTLDLMCGYYQIPVAEDSRHLTSFVTPDAQYQFKRAPFGLTNSPAVFMRLMSKILKELNTKDVLVYMDDVLIATKTLDDTFLILEKFFILLKRFNLTLNIKKCNFLCSRSTYLGHEITAQGVQPGDRKTEAIKSFPVPKTTREVRQFLGLTSFFRRFIQDFAKKAAPLNKILRKGTEFSWTEDHQKSFELLKMELCQQPILALYDVNACHELHTDASSEGIAGILMQIGEDSKKKVVSYFSRSTTPTEAKFHSFELEALAVVESLERFKYYLLNKHFKILTDCNSLKLSHQKRDLIPKIARWWLKIQEFSFELEYRPGKQMAHVDALSRGPSTSSEPKECQTVCSDMMRIGMEEESWITTLQMQDDGIAAILNLLQGKGDKEAIKNAQREYTFLNGCVYKNTVKGLRFVVPKGIRWRVIKTAHDDAGHGGDERTLDLLKRNYWFQNMNKTVKMYIASCIQCLYNKRDKDETRHQLYSIERVAVPFHTIHIDHLGPLPKSKRGNIYILGIIDAFTKYIILRPVKSTATLPVIKTLEEMSGFVGLPAYIVTDRGTAYTSKKFRDFCDNKGIKLKLIAAKTPRANGQIERYFRTVTTSLASMTTDFEDKDWETHLKGIEWGLNSISHRITGKTPQQLLFDFKPRNVLENQMQLTLVEGSDDEDIPLSELRERIKATMNKTRKTQADKYNQEHRPPREYKKGDLVLLRADQGNTGQSRKLLPRYKGPYIISEKLEHDRYIVEDTPTTQVTQKPFRSTYSADRMKPWCRLEDFEFGELTDDSTSEVSE